MRTRETNRGGGIEAGGGRAREKMRGKRECITGDYLI